MLPPPSSLDMISFSAEKSYSASATRSVHRGGQQQVLVLDFARMTSSGDVKIIISTGEMECRTTVQANSASLSSFLQM